MQSRQCDYCKTPFKPVRQNQRFCTTPGNNCRVNWHKANTLTGKVTGIRALKGGGWSIIIHQPNRPTIEMGTQVRIETKA